MNCEESARLPPVLAGEGVGAQTLRTEMQTPREPIKIKPSSDNTIVCRLAYWFLIRAKLPSTVAYDRSIGNTREGVWGEVVSGREERGERRR